MREKKHEFLGTGRDEPKRYSWANVLNAFPGWSIKILRSMGMLESRLDFSRVAMSLALIEERQMLDRLLQSLLEASIYH